MTSTKIIGSMTKSLRYTISIKVERQQDSWTWQPVANITKEKAGLFDLRDVNKAIRPIILDLTTEIRDDIAEMILNEEEKLNDQQA